MEQRNLATEIETLQLRTTRASDALDRPERLHPIDCSGAGMPEMTDDGAPAQSTGQNVMEWQGFPWMKASRGEDRTRRSDRRSNRSMRAGGSLGGPTGTLPSRSSVDSCRDDPSAGQFKVGDLVRARYGKYDEADGVIKVVNRDGTYGVLFQDGRYYGKAVHVTARGAEAAAAVLGFEEFAALPEHAGFARTELRLLFDMFDSDHHGTLELEEFLKFREHFALMCKDKFLGVTPKHRTHQMVWLSRSSRPGDAD